MNTVQVVFSGKSPEISGKVMFDPAKRGKIVFISGLKQNFQTWRDPLPHDKEEWICEVLKDTLPENPRKGALLIRLVKKAEAKIVWDCQPNKKFSVSGFFLPIITKITFMGERQENFDEIGVYRQENIRPEWPTNIREKAEKMLIDYEGAVAQFESKIEWPSPLPTSDPNSYSFPVEVCGVATEIITRVVVSEKGIERLWYCSGVGHSSIQGLSQLLSNEIKSAGGISRITKYAEFCALCKIFGKPVIKRVYPGSSKAGDSEVTLDEFDREEVSVIWGDFSESMPVPKIIFEGPYKIDVANINEYGGVVCKATLFDFDLTLNVKGLQVEPEKKLWVTTGCEKPVVEPADVNRPAHRVLSKEQCYSLVAGMEKHSLADYTFLFRSALLGSDKVKEVVGDVEFLKSRTILDKKFTIEKLPFKVHCSEPESDDGYRRAREWTETRYYPCLVWGGGHIAIEETLATDLTAAVKWFKSDLVGRIREQMESLRTSFGSEAVYSKQPTYSEPATTVSIEKQQELSRKIEELLNSIQVVVEKEDNV